jgi:mRNA interferase MazF
LDFDPAAGREQAGRRPGLVLSPLAFNVATGIAYVLPITNQLKGSGMEVGLPAGLGVTGGVLCDNMRALDWIARNSQLAGKAPELVINEVKARLDAILQLSAGESET